jgi:dienelactone hydrolase
MKNRYTSRHSFLTWTFFAYMLGVSPARAQAVSVFDTVYTPPGDPGGASVGTIFVPPNSNGIGVVVVHGGGVGRATNRPWCDTLAARGYVVLTIDYPDASTVYPVGARAVKLAIEFMRRDSVQLPISSGHIVGLAFSNGASFMAEALPWDNDDAYFNTDPQIDDHLDAAILLYGGYSEDQVAPPARSCIRNVEQISTPVLLMHGTADTFVHWTQSQEFYDSLLAHQKVCQLRLFVAGGHGFELNWPFTTAFTDSGLVAKNTALSFLRQVLNLSTAVSEFPKHRSMSFLLDQNYPNPFNPTTVIDYQLPTSTLVLLKVFDILGRDIKTLVDERQSEGNHSVKLTVDNLPSGVYIYRLEAGPYHDTKKLLLLK